MKFLSLTSLALAAALINDTDTGDILISSRIEAYTMKRAGTDKKLYKDLESQYKAELATLSRSPNKEPLSASPIGSMVDKRCRETLIELISTLNAAFPDYDFRSLRGENFVKEELWKVVNAIDSRLENIIPDYAKAKKAIWESLEQEIQPQECTIYSFIPDVGSNPFEEEGYIWSFNYFFYNKKKLKRIVLWTCSAQWKGDMEPTDVPTLHSQCIPISPVPDGEYTMDMMMNYDY
eukprot:TRINITY_DN4210_c0_g1_i1.p2 TRINITY_DN4210_c0_g1~~TRINITY_DN4210_c0_g1_i1.p2  ORF type:complete len:235 (-),score=29.14 TRINITY_DN4210_c0_g1_i1:167-871(-)